jgi:predicted acetyltransferase
MAMTIRPCTAEEFTPALRACEQAFGRGVTDMDAARWARVVDPSRLLAAVDDGAIIGTAGAYGLTLTIPGGFVPAAGVMMVGTLPTHRRRGVFGGLMKQLLHDAYQRGESAAILWASEGGLYEQFGFGLGSRNASIDIETYHAAFRDAPTAECMRRLVGFDEAASVVAPIYDEVRRTSPGMIERSAEWWRAYRFEDPVHERGGGGPLQCCTFECADVSAGYVLYRFHDAYERRLHHDWLEVVESVEGSVTVTRDIWRYLLSMDLVERVRANFMPEDHPLTLMLREPGRLRLTLSDGLWLRLLDVGAALGARSYTGDGSIVLEVDDPNFEWNTARWCVEADSTGSAVSRSNARPDIRLAVADLAAVFLGAFTFMDLYHAGRLHADREAVVKAATLFQRRRAPWCPEVI